MPAPDTQRLAYLDDISTASRRDRGEAFAAVAQLGSRDATCTLWSDSTGNENIEWYRLMVNAYAALHPKARVLYYPWDDATKKYLAAAVVQAGATSTATTKPLVDTFTRTVADLKGSVADTGQVWGGDTNSTGDWSIDGAKLVRTSDATGSVTVVDSGVQGDHRLVVSGVALDTTTAASTRAFFARIKHLNSTNYLTFELRVTTAGVMTAYIHKMIAGVYTTMTSKGAPVAVGSNIGFDLVLKNVGAEVTATLNGNTLTATLTDTDLAALAQGSSIGVSATAPMAGMSIAGLELEVTGTGLPAQTLNFYCGALSGSSLDYQVANLDAILPAETDVLILSSVHNNGSMLGAAFVSKLETVVATARKRAPRTGIIISSQNPQKSPAVGVVAHYARNVAVAGAARARGWGYLPVFEAFAARADGGFSYVKSVDGVHPTTSADVANPDNGSSLWAQVALDYFADVVPGARPTAAAVDAYSKAAADARFAPIGATGGGGAAATTDAAALTTGYLAPERLNLTTANGVAVRSAAGALIQVLLSSSVVANTLAYRGTGGVLAVGTPTDPTHAATKAYTDQLRTDIGVVADNLGLAIEARALKTDTYTKAQTDTQIGTKVGIILIPAGGAIPEGTPAGTLVLERKA